MRCSYCHQRGHNRRTCPVLTERMKANHDLDIAAGYTDSWAIQEYKDRIKPKGTKKANQQCGYCEEYGHTRRTCEKLQQDMKWYIDHHNEMVKIAYDYILNSRVGIGSLFTRKERRWEDGGYKDLQLHLVLTDFRIPFSIKSHQFSIYATLTNVEDGRVFQYDVRPWVKDLAYVDRWQSTPKLVAPVAGAMDPSWSSENSMNAAKAKVLDLFSRSGRKDEDRREWAFGKMESAKRYLEKSEEERQQWLYKDATSTLEALEPKNIRAKMFEDFKSV